MPEEHGGLVICWIIYPTMSLVILEMSGEKFIDLPKRGFRISFGGSPKIDQVSNHQVEEAFGNSFQSLSE